jgi:riboflavin-specific deaminase-like protein
VRRLAAREIRPEETEAAYRDLAGLRAVGRPYVAVNMVMSADGAIAVEGRTKDLSSDADRRVFHHLRSLADVILVGAQTVRDERYGPPRITDERQAERVARGQAPVPRIAIVSGSLDLDWSAPLFTESRSRPLVLTTVDADTTEAARVADVVVAGERRVDLAAALASLDAGLVLCEGGPTLNGVLASADLIDELCLTIAGTLVGGAVAAGILGHVQLPGLVPMRLVHALEEDGDLFLRYRRSAVRSGEAPAATTATMTTASPARVDAFHEMTSAVDLPMVIVTAASKGERSGCLVGFHAQSSIDPPTYTVWISKKNHTYRVATSADTLAVHFLAADQHDLAVLFGEQTGDEVDKFASCAAHEGPQGTVVLDDVSRWFAGRIIETVETGDHVAFVLQPLAGEAGPWPGQLGLQQVLDLQAGHRA